MSAKKIITLGLILLSMNLVVGQISLGTSLRYQMDQRDPASTSTIRENYGIHLVPSLEFEYQKKGFIMQFSLGAFGGGSEINNSSSGIYNFQTGPPISYSTESWSYIQEYKYLSSRIAFSCRFFQKSNFNLDLGLFYSTDFLVNEENREHVHTYTTGTQAFTDTGGTFHPMTAFTTTDNDPFQLARFISRYAYAGIRLAPQIKIMDRVSVGVELNVKFQWNYRVRDDMYHEDLTNYDFVALDYLLRLSYTFGNSTAKE